MDESFNTIRLGDCVAGMDALPAGSADLVFADPPFNIGYSYDVYEDSVEHQEYIDWCGKWIAAVHRVLKADGTFWLAIGDDYAAELKIESQKAGFHCRSWVIWYYTFGVNCSRKFTRSHTHLFHFVKDREHFTFRDEDLDNRVPSARELVYNDSRADPKGRLPDDTWIIRPAQMVGEMVGDDDGTWAPESLAPPVDADRTYTLRPQDLGQSFGSTEDTWYFPRVAGTFKERAGFHGCQMPEQLLGRIIRTCSNPGEMVLDPFSGSATTLAVAKKLGRCFLGFDVSKDYVQYGLDRLRAIRVGDRLDGSPEPMKSAPRTAKRGKKRGRMKKLEVAKFTQEELHSSEKRYARVQLEMTLQGVVEAFRRTHDGFSADRVVADPDLNKEFVGACSNLGLVGDARTWNMLLFRLRKGSKLSPIPTVHRTHLSWEDCDRYIFASEIAWQRMLNDEAATSLDEILCDPALAAEFDKLARQFAPGHKPLEYRWAALKLRKEAKDARSRAIVLKLPHRFGVTVSIEELTARSLPEEAGLYVLSEDSKRSRNLYVGETLNLRSRLTLNRRHVNAWRELSPSPSIFVQMLAMDCTTAGKLAWQSCLVKKYKPRLNCFELRPAS
ncbi:DNA-methyltransferase [Anaerobaca lacustris]|uniref:Site-specific DNA-methyltransferase n=1 Tax=Anaerobaca lacustris TaxID=3044600 RepID=A0AAW6TYP8_9BACT|nr:site-specific DNA-methyltransferase [Sedimentisphaerales bacterium M17dextr]